MGFWIFMGVAIGIAALILSVIGWVNRCKECGNLGHAFVTRRWPVRFRLSAPKINDLRDFPTVLRTGLLLMSHNFSLSG